MTANKSRRASSLLLATLVIIAGGVFSASLSAQTGDDDALIAEGVAALEHNDVTKARGIFERALSLNSGNVAAHTYLGLIADRSGDLKEAERHFAAAVDLMPSSPSTRNNLGAVLLKLGRSQQAAAQFEASLRIDKDQPNALVNLAQIRFAANTNKDLVEARELFLRAYALAPDAELARAVVVISLRVNDKASASKYYAAYRERLSTPAASAELGSALLEAQLWQEAVTELSSSLAAEPSNSETVVRLARAQIALKDLPAAGRTLESAVARGVDPAPVYALLASVYEQTGHVENAIPAMRLAIERDPQSERYRFTYGLLLINASAPDAAVIRLKEALETSPNSPRLWLGLGIAYFKGGKNDEAAKALIRAIDLDAKFAPPFAYLGMTYVEIGQYDQAVKSYEQSLSIDTKLGVVHYLIADAMQKQTSAEANSAKIEQHLFRAVELEPGFAPARLALGKLYLRNNKFAEAVEQFERVIKLDANVAEAYYQLGRAYTKLKRTADAQTAMATFKRLSDSQKEQGLQERKEIVRRLADVLF